MEFPVRLSSFRSVLILLLCGATSCAPESAAPAAPTPKAQAPKPKPEVKPPVPRSGSQIFAQMCALCHGENGDGNGTLKLDRPARSFTEGTFSFGNTREALFRTVGAGIGGTPMPGFGSTMTDVERYAVVDHVIGLGPERQAAPVGATVMNVTDRPLAVRGSFKALDGSDDVIPRGLLLGGLDGLSFQYDASAVDLIAVRQGEFVDRRDWENRGGDTLDPLGQVIFENSGASVWRFNDAVLEARLTGTTILDGKAWIEYDLFNGDVHVANVRETGMGISRGGWSGFQRNFIVTGAGPENLSFEPWAAEPGRELYYGIDRSFRLVEHPVRGTTLFGVNEWLTNEGFGVISDTYFGLTDTPENLAAFEEAL